MTAIKTWRTRLGWSQARASRELRCSTRSVQTWESGAHETPGYILIAAAWIWSRERPFDPVPFRVPGPRE